MQLYVISPVWHLYATYINFNIFTVASYFPVKRNYLLTLYAMSLVKYIYVHWFGQLLQPNVEDIAYRYRLGHLGIRD